MPEFLLTFDVETTSIVRNGLFDDVGSKVLMEGLPPILDILDQKSIKSTFFFTGYIAKNFPETVKIVHSHGHEIGSHGLGHRPDQAFDLLDLEEQVKQLFESKKIIEDIIGERIVSFRAPALRVNQYTPKALMKSGFEIDSSIASQRFDMFLSFGSLKKINRLIAPRMPYFTSENNLARKGSSSIYEIPISALAIPYIGTTLRLLPNVIKIIRFLLLFENKFVNGKPIVFLFHPNEILKEDVNSPYARRSKNIVSYILKDKIRRNLKIKNLGENGFNLLKREINYFTKFDFLTLRDYAKNKVNINKISC